MNLILLRLSHPLTRGLSVDDPQTTLLRRRIIRDKTFLRSIYCEWYGKIVSHLPASRKAVLELGSGAGFFTEFLPEVITSEVFEMPGVARVVDACDLPFPAQALDAIVMTDVFHHIPDSGRFLHEAARCIRGGGRVIMVEPWRTPWSEWVYTRLHTEPFSPDGSWTLPPAGPLSGANGALPWIVFERDRLRFEQDHPQWRLLGVKVMMPFVYLLSGGVSLRALAPGWMYGFCRRLERRLNQCRWGMFALIVLERTESQSARK